MNRKPAASSSSRPPSSAGRGAGLSRTRASSSSRPSSAVGPSRTRRFGGSERTNPDIIVTSSSPDQDTDAPRASTPKKGDLPSPSSTGFLDASDISSISTASIATRRSDPSPIRRSNSNRATKLAEHQKLKDAQQREILVAEMSALRAVVENYELEQQQAKKSAEVQAKVDKLKTVLENRMERSNYLATLCHALPLLAKAQKDVADAKALYENTKGELPSKEEMASMGKPLDCSLLLKDINLSMDDLKACLELGLKLNPQLKKLASIKDCVDSISQSSREAEEVLRALERKDQLLEEEMRWLAHYESLLLSVKLSREHK